MTKRMSQGFMERVLDTGAKVVSFHKGRVMEYRRGPNGVTYARPRPICAREQKEQR